MANVINKDYFIRERLIAGLDKSTVSTAVVKFIEEYEATFLRKALGYGFYKIFMEGASAVEPAQRWVDLIDGGEYYRNGRLAYWEGLRQADVKDSMIADYVYYFYMRNHITQTATISEVTSDTENATKATPGYKMERNWNGMVSKVSALWHYLQFAVTDDSKKYPEFAFSEVDVRHFRHINTFGI